MQTMPIGTAMENIPAGDRVELDPSNGQVRRERGKPREVNDFGVDRADMSLALAIQAHAKERGELITLSQAVHISQEVSSDLATMQANREAPMPGEYRPVLVPQPTEEAEPKVRRYDIRISPDGESVEVHIDGYPAEDVSEAQEAEEARPEPGIEQYERLNTRMLEAERWAKQSEASASRYRQLYADCLAALQNAHSRYGTALMNTDNARDDLVAVMATRPELEPEVETRLSKGVANVLFADSQLRENNMWLYDTTEALRARQWQSSEAASDETPF